MTLNTEDSKRNRLVLKLLKKFVLQSPLKFHRIVKQSSGGFEYLDLKKKDISLPVLFPFRVSIEMLFDTSYDNLDTLRCQKKARQSKNRRTKQQ